MALNKNTVLKMYHPQHEMEVHTDF